MFFTTGKHRKYERIMQMVPGFDDHRDLAIAVDNRERNCPDCLYYSPTEGKCSRDTCTVFSSDSQTSNSTVSTTFFGGIQ